MNPTKRLKYFLEVKRNELYSSVFSGNLRPNIHLWVASQLPDGPMTDEEKSYLDQQITNMSNDIARMMTALRVRDGVIIHKPGYQGQEGVISKGPGKLEQDKRKMLYQIEIEDPNQPGTKVTIDCTALEIERKQMPKGVLVPGHRTSVPPLTPQNRPRI